MAGLQRSAVSFRRQGSSGLVWDDKLISGELNQASHKQEQQQDQQEQHHQQQPTPLDKLDTRRQETDAAKPPSRSINTIERSRSNGGQRGYRTGRVSPAIEPPSPKVSACGICSAFGKPPKNHHRKRAGKGRSR
ncbi:hypothetical protein Tsubulata_049321 [Turnera subulata]|uniref:MAPK kinase substrate protein n=1 Tax=Turnera subulata TaxID=218843 RepID=A0A9Q0JP50_9ROSI|nr:hypothetical protein Tsubulata_049321 [Turnera subulata]